MDADATSAPHKRGVATPNGSFKFTWFKQFHNHKSVIKAIYTCSEYVDRADAGNDVGISLESTSFYAEQSGQICDIGLLAGPSALFEVCNIQIYGGFVLHLGKISGESVRFHDIICKRYLGVMLTRKDPLFFLEKLRFDFSHGKLVKPGDLCRIKSIVNEQIKFELEVYAKEASLANAKRVHSLRAVFSEVYPDPLKIVAIGRQVDDLLPDPENSLKVMISTC